MRARFSRKAHRVHNRKRSALKLAFEKLKGDGMMNLHYLKGEHLLGDDGEASTDGSHPTDLGMVRYADAYENALREII